MHARAHHSDVPSQRSWQDTARAFARGVAGGLLVAMPLLMTMEMWWLGFAMPAPKLLLFLGVNFGVLYILEYYSGFHRYHEVNRFEEARDAVISYGIGFAVAAVVLYVLRVLRPDASLQAAVGKIALQAIPISMGVSVAVAQLGSQSPEASQRKEETGFWGSQAVAVAGAMLFGFNIAPTVEPMLLGLRMYAWNALALQVLSLLLVHAVVYYVDFRGQPRSRRPTYRLVMSSVTSYLIALLLAAYLLWTFGRLSMGTGVAAAVHMTVALGFVTSLGAAAGKLLL